MRSRPRRPVGVEQAEVELLPEHPGRRAVDDLRGHGAGRGQVEQRLAEAAGARQLDVEPGGERERRRLALAGGDRMLQFKEGDRVIVGDDHPVEAVLPAQQGGQQAGIRAGGHAVDVDVARHHRARAAEPDGHLERGEDDVGELARPHGHRGMVPSGPGGGVGGEVLERGLDPGPLQPAHVRGADGPDQVRVLADGFLGAAPAVVAGHVEHRGETLVDADRVHRRAEGRGHLSRRAPDRTRRPRRAGWGRSSRPRRRSRSGTPRARPRGCRACWLPRPWPAARRARSSRPRR